MSHFNCIEFAFRFIKHKLYLNLFENIEKTEQYVEGILKSDEIKKSLIKNFKEVLEEYSVYFSNNKYLNLNNLIYNH